MPQAPLLGGEASDSVFVVTAPAGRAATRRSAAAAACSRETRTPPNMETYPRPRASTVASLLFTLRISDRAATILDTHAVYADARTHRQVVRRAPTGGTPPPPPTNRHRAPTRHGRRRRDPQHRPSTLGKTGRSAARDREPAGGCRAQVEQMGLTAPGAEREGHHPLHLRWRKARHALDRKDLDAVLMAEKARAHALRNGRLAKLILGTLVGAWSSVPGPRPGRRRAARARPPPYAWAGRHRAMSPSPAMPLRRSASGAGSGTTAVLLRSAMTIA